MLASFEFIESSPKLKNGKLVVSFPSIYMFDEFYSHGKILAEIISLSHNMKAFVRISTIDFYPEIPLQYVNPDQIDYVSIDTEGIASLPEFEKRLDMEKIPHFSQNCYAEFLKCDGNFVLLTKPRGHSPSLFMRDYSEMYLRIAKEIGVTEVYAVGTRLSETSPRGRLTGYATTKNGVERLKQNDVKLMQNELALYFTNVILGVASEQFGMTGYRINSNHGETPPYEDSIKQMLDKLQKISNISYNSEVFDEVMNDWVSSQRLAHADNLSNQK